MRFKWLRDTNKVYLGNTESGYTYGQISFNRLAEFLVKNGEVMKGEDIAAFHFDFDRKMIIYRLKRD